MRVTVENLSYTYGKQTKNLAVKALKNVSLSIEEGDFFGIIGKTGSGKSTFIQHLNGLIKIEKGEGKIIIGDFDLSDKKCDFQKLRSKVGMVFQYPEYQLFAETVKEDVAYGIKNFFSSKSEAETEQMVKEAINMVGLCYDEIKDKSPFELSGGQKRRVAIAGVIVTQPEILVLDEPAAGLDPIGKREFIGILKKIHKTFAKTIIIVSHDMDLIAENCNKAAVFSDGEIIATGSPKEIFKDEKEVEAYGLELPITAFVTQELLKKNIDLNNDLTVADFIRATQKFAEGEEK